ncbi:MAG: hypothetical protein V5A55_01970 [Halovenus sp.]
MVEDRITDSKRIAQLLASELSGLSTGPLAGVSVVDADTDATPSEDGTVAYGVSHGSERVATVRLYPGYVSVEPELGTVDIHPAETDELPVGERVRVTRREPQGLTIALEDGASVKDCVDLLRDLLA